MYTVYTLDGCHQTCNQSHIQIAPRAQIWVVHVSPCKLPFFGIFTLILGPFLALASLPLWATDGSPPPASSHQITTRMITSQPAINLDPLPVLVSPHCPSAGPFFCRIPQSLLPIRHFFDANEPPPTKVTTQLANQLSINLLIIATKIGASNSTIPGNCFPSSRSFFGQQSFRHN